MKKSSLVMSSSETLVITSNKGSAIDDDDIALAQGSNPTYGSLSITGHYALQKRSK